MNLQQMVPTSTSSSSFSLHLKDLTWPSLAPPLLEMQVIPSWWRPEKDLVDIPDTSCLFLLPVLGNALLF
jgi:hypothetical protein